MKKVSVIMPTYKRNDYIIRALESVLAQDYPNVEVVVVDDNGIGTDDQIATEKKLRKYIDENRIVYIKNEKNQGGAFARNHGIEKSTGDYITFLDDDDEYLPGKISIQVQEMEKNNLDLCVMDGETYDNSGNKLSHKIQPFDTDMPQEEILKAHIVRHITGTNVFMFRREALIKIGMFDQIAAGQEFMIMLKAITSGLRIGCIHDVYVHFHMDGQERISTRLSKVEGLNKVYSEKQRFFDILSKDEKAYIKAKHHGTLFYVYYINKKFLMSGIELLKAVISSPKYTWETYEERKGKLKSR